MLRQLLVVILGASVAILIIPPGTSALNCPPELIEALAPCKCNEDWEPRLICSEDTDLKEVFDRASLVVDPDHVFESIRVVGLSAREFPENMMSSLKFKKITVEYMSNLVYIHPDAFNATYDVTQILHMPFNPLSSNEENHDLFKFFGKFTKVAEFYFYGNGLINYIPDDPFEQTLPALKSIRLSQSPISYLGARIFANLPNLEIIYLNSCDIRLEEIADDAFEGIGPNTIVDMQYNPIAELPERIFRPVLESAKQLVVGGADCPFEWCTDWECDQRADWICEGESVYRPKLGGYKCKSWYSFADIWEYCASLKSNNNTLSY